MGPTFVWWDSWIVHVCVYGSRRLKEVRQCCYYWEKMVHLIISIHAFLAILTITCLMYILTFYPCSLLPQCFVSKLFFTPSDQCFIFYLPQMCSLGCILSMTQVVWSKIDKNSLFNNLKVDPSGKPFRTPSGSPRFSCHQYSWLEGQSDLNRCPRSCTITSQYQ